MTVRTSRWVAAPVVAALTLASFDTQVQAQNTDRNPGQAQNQERDGGRRGNSPMAIMKGFEGILQGTVVNAGMGEENRNLMLKVDKVVQLHPANKASKPEDIVGRNLQITPKWNKAGDGKFEPEPSHLQFIRSLKKGQSTMIHVKEEGGKIHIVNPNPQLEQAQAAQQPAQQQTQAELQAAPQTPAADATAAGQLPQEIKGFDGTLQGTIVKVGESNRAITMKVDKVLHVNQRSQAERPESVVGKVVAVGVSEAAAGDAAARDRRQEEFFKSLKEGQSVQLDVADRGGDQLKVVQLTEMQKRPAGEPAVAAALPQEIKGFDGTLQGTVTKVGEGKRAITMKVDKVLHVNQRSRAEKPESVVGKTVSIGVSEATGGDAASRDRRQENFFKTLREGQTLQLDVADRGGEQLKVVQLTEVQKRLAEHGTAFDPLPAEFRNFDGTLQGKVLAVGDQKRELVMKVDKVLHVNQRSRAEKPESIVGKTVAIGVRSQPDAAAAGASNYDAQQAGFVATVKEGDNLQLDVRDTNGQLQIADLTAAQKAAAEQQPSGDQPARQSD